CVTAASARTQRPQVGGAERGQVGSRTANEVVELLLRLLATLAARGALGITVVPGAGPSPVSLPCQLAQLRLEAVVVAPRELLPPSDVGEEAIDLVHGAVAVVDVVARRRRRAHTGERLHDGVDGRVAVERVPAPGRREVAPLHQLPPRPAESRPGAVLGPSPAHLLAQRAPHAGAGLC